MNCKNCEYGLKQSYGDFEKILCTYEEGECVKITELEATNKTISNECHKLVDSLEKKQNEIAELKKESDFYHREKGEYKSAFLQEVRKTIKLNKQLTKAKGIINRLSTCFSSYSSNIFEEELLKEAEQFISEVEK